LKAPSVEDIVPVLRKALGNKRRDKGVIITVDVDPY
jgi:hypothetical protein